MRDWRYTKYVDVSNNSEVKEVLKNMCGLGESLELKAEERGKLSLLIELVESGDLTVEKASEKAGMTEEAFREKMQK